MAILGVPIPRGQTFELTVNANRVLTLEDLRKYNVTSLRITLVFDTASYDEARRFLDDYAKEFTPPSE